MEQRLKWNDAMSGLHSLRVTGEGAHWSISTKRISIAAENNPKFPFPGVVQTSETVGRE